MHSKRTQPMAMAGSARRRLPRPSLAACCITSVAAHALPAARNDDAMVLHAAAFTTAPCMTQPPSRSSPTSICICI